MNKNRIDANFFKISDSIIDIAKTALNFKNEQKQHLFNFSYSTELLIGLSKILRIFHQRIQSFS